MMSNGEQKRPANREPEQGRSLRSAPSTPLKAAEQQTPPRSESLNSLPKIPSGNSPYVKAKHVQLVDKDPNRAISLFWAAINSGDRVNSALKDMAIAMKQVGRADEAVEAIKSFRYLCSADAQESLDNVLLDLYKRCGRMDEQIELLEHKLKLIEEGLVFGGKRTKIARSQGKKFLLSIDQERSRLLGNLAWAHLQKGKFQTAEALYRLLFTQSGRQDPVGEICQNLLIATDFYPNREVDRTLLGDSVETCCYTTELCCKQMGRQNSVDKTCQNLLALG